MVKIQNRDGAPRLCMRRMIRCLGKKLHAASPSDEIGYSLGAMLMMMDFEAGVMLPRARCLNGTSAFDSGK